MTMKAFRLEGSSMLPVFIPGGIAFVQPPAPEPSSHALSPGDCAVYALEGRVLLHRVVKTVAAGAWFADDSGRLAPHFVPRERIRGKVLSRNPLAGGFCGHIYSRLRRALFPFLA